MVVFELGSNVAAAVRKLAVEQLLVTKQAMPVTPRLPQVKVVLVLAIL